MDIHYYSKVLCHICKQTIELYRFAEEYHKWHCALTMLLTVVFSILGNLEDW